MKHLVVIAILIFVIKNVSNAQSIFENLNFENALKKAQTTGKSLLVQFETNSNCKTCNKLGKVQFNDSIVKNKVLQNFIPIYIKSDDIDLKYIHNVYELNDESFGTLFIENNGDLLYKYLETSTHNIRLIKALDSALFRNTESLKLSVIQSIYSKTNNIDDLELLIITRNSRGLTTDALLEEYVTKFKPSDSGNDSRILFALKQAPIINSKANFVTLSYYKYNQLWFSMPTPERIAINNKIVYKTRIKALKEKDEKLVTRIASFLNTMYSDTKEKQFANRRINELFMTYYDNVNDVRFYDYAINYYDSFFMVMSVDSINKMDIIRKEKMHQEAKKNIKHTDTIINGKLVRKNSFSYSYLPIAQNYTNLYNRIAWRFYTTTKNEVYLKKALSWAERGYQHYKNPNILNTYARLLYVLGNKQKAIIIIKECMELYKNKENNINDDNTKKVYELMLQGKSSIDEYH